MGDFWCENRTLRAGKVAGNHREMRVRMYPFFLPR